MAVPSRYILHQGPVLGALARAVWQSQKGASKSAPTLPGPELHTTVTPRPKDLVRDYIKHVGGDPSAYRGQVPAHLFPQWVFPLQSRGLEGLPYPLQRVLNGGCRLEMNAPLPIDEPFELTCRLEDIDDNGRRAVIHQRAVMATKDHPEAVVAHVYAIVPLKSDKTKSNGSAKKTNGQAAEKKQPKVVPADAVELARWKIRHNAGLDFAKLTGDFNPIHWIVPAAKAAGFRNVILHGFATFARSVEGLNRALFAGSVDRLAWIDVQFTKPLVLPADVGLYHQGKHIFVGNAPGGAAYLVGEFAVRNEK